MLLHELINGKKIKPMYVYLNHHDTQMSRCSALSFILISNKKTSCSVSMMDRTTGYIKWTK